MAMTKKRTNKNGSVSYEIRVSMGRDINGKQIFKYSTWAPQSNMTERQIEKELQRQAVLFEEKCRQGRVLDTSIKFADFAEQWLQANEDIHAPAYQQNAKFLLTRINAGIGHLRLDKLTPHHLQMFYKNLSEEGVRVQQPGMIATALNDVMAQKEITKTALTQKAGISCNTMTVACQGKRISYKTAEKIAAALETDIHKLFQEIEGSDTLSEKTVLHHHRLISSILETAVKWQVLYDNPARRVEPPKVHKKEAVYLDDKQALEVLTALEKQPLKWQTAIMLLMYSGMRRGELCGLTWSNVDFKNSLLHIEKANQYLSGKGIFEKDTKTESSERVIKLPDEVFSLLRQFRSWQTQERLKMRDRWIESGKVFTQNNGKPMHPDTVTSWVKKFTEKNNLPSFSPHSLRHTNATLLIMSGIPVKAVSARLGHANQNVTNAIYSHSIQTADALASDIVGEILNPKKNPAREA